MPKKKKVTKKKLAKKKVTKVVAPPPMPEEVVEDVEVVEELAEGEIDLTFGHIGINIHRNRHIRDKETYQTRVVHVTSAARPHERAEILNVAKPFIDRKEVLKRVVVKVGGQSKMQAMDVPAKAEDLLSIGLRFGNTSGVTLNPPKFVLSWSDGHRDWVDMPESLLHLSKFD